MRCVRGVLIDFTLDFEATNFDRRPWPWVARKSNKELGHFVWVTKHENENWWVNHNILLKSNKNIAAWMQRVQGGVARSHWKSHQKGLLTSDIGRLLDTFSFVLKCISDLISFIWKLFIWNIEPNTNTTPNSADYTGKVSNMHSRQIALFGNAPASHQNKSSLQIP
jgi:hypothetical protein